MSQDNAGITEEQFEAYEAVRKSGVTNMFHVSMVSELSGLERGDVMMIMSTYASLCKRWPDVRTLPKERTL